MVERARAIGHKARCRRQIDGELGTLDEASRGDAPVLHGALCRNVFGKAPCQKRAKVAKTLKAVHTQESREASEAMRLGATAKIVREGRPETLTYTDFPMKRWTRIRTNNATVQLNKEIHQRTRAVGTFTDGKSALMLVAARMKNLIENEHGRRRHLDVSLPEEKEDEARDNSADGPT